MHVAWMWNSVQPSHYCIHTCSVIQSRQPKACSLQDIHQLECGPMPNVMAALLNIGGALRSTPQSSADAHY